MREFRRGERRRARERREDAPNCGARRADEAERISEMPHRSVCMREDPGDVRVRRAIAVVFKRASCCMHERGRRRRHGCVGSATRPSMTHRACGCGKECVESCGDVYARKRSVTQLFRLIVVT
eukprot:1240746-Pleurochrysis_carterae.AAC.2